MNLLEEILARAQAPMPAGAVPTDINTEFETQPGAIPGSLLDALTQKKKKKFEEMPSPAAPQLPAWGQQAGMIAPGVGGLGNMAPATAAAPMSPVDPNYADPQGTKPDFMTGAERQMQSLVDPAAAGASRVPLPAARPREADGTIAPEPARTPTDISSANRGPAAEEEQATAPSAAGQSPQPQAPQMAQPSLWDKVGGLASKVMGGLHDNSNLLLALGAGFAGAPNIGQGISRASQFAIPASQQDLKNRMTTQNQSQTYRAMIEAGVPQQQALAAIGNPELQKRLLDSYITDRKWEIKTIKSKDQFGNDTERLVAVNPYDPTKSTDITGTQGGTQAGGGGDQVGKMAAVAQMPPMYDPQTHRDEAFMTALKEADPMTAAAVQDIADGKMPASGRNLQKLMPMAARYEAGFEANRFSARQNLEKSYFGGGEGGKALRSANTVIDHGIDLKKAIEDLHNFSILPQYLNSATGAVQKQFDPKYQKALKKFKANAEVYARELDFALTGKSTVSGQKEIRGMFDQNAAPGENMASLEKTLSMLEKRIGEHEQTYRSGMNRSGGVFAGDMLTNRKKLDQLLAGENPDKPAAVAAPAPGRYVFDPATRTMKPLQ